MGGYTNVLNLYLRKLFIYYVNNTFSRHRLRLVGRTDGGLHPAFYSSPNGDIVEHRICEITRDSGYPPPPRNLANPPSVGCKWWATQRTERTESQ
jgi:hypothetical protein